jgi:hypothetical protein
MSRENRKPSFGTEKTFFVLCSKSKYLLDMVSRMEMRSLKVEVTLLVF